MNILRERRKGGGTGAYHDLMRSSLKYSTGTRCGGNSGCVCDGLLSSSQILLPRFAVLFEPPGPIVTRNHDTLDHSWQYNLAYISRRYGTYRARARPFPRLLSTRVRLVNWVICRPQKTTPTRLGPTTLSEVFLFYPLSFRSLE